VWRERVAWLRERLGVFNGRRVVAVATDARTDPAAAVREALGPGCEYAEVPNDPRLREVATFRPLFDRVADLTGPEHCTLYAHAKGATREPDSVCQHWTAALYEVLIDHWALAAADLKRFPVTGAFKKTGHGWRAGYTRSDWHYSGSWFWVRNADLFARPDWGTIDRFWSGIEPYPSLHFAAADAGCYFHPGRVGEVNLYDWDYWRSRVDPDLAAFRARHPL
jgi:hypothetical protein